MVRIRMEMTKKNQREAKFQKKTYKGLEGRLCETQ